MAFSLGEWFPALASGHGTGSVDLFFDMKLLLQEMKATWKLAIPMVMGQVAQHVLHVVDLAMIGRVGVTPLAAATFSGNVFWIFALFTFGLASALSIMVSEAHGRADAVRAREVLRIGLLVCGLAALTGSCVLGAIILGTDWWYLGQPMVVLEEARNYLIYLAISLVPLMLFSSLKGYCEAINQPWLPLYFVIGSIGANVLLNWVFIFGNLGAPAMGLDGAGLATVLARLLSVVALWGWMMWARAYRLRWRWGEFFRLETASKWELIKLGTPIGLQISFEMAAFNAAVFMMGWMYNGPVAIAAHSIAISYAGLAFMVPLGITFAVSIRIGQARGEGDLAKARRIGWGAMLMAAAFMAAMALTFVTFRHQMPLLFLPPKVGEDAPAVIALASVLLLFAAAFAIFDGVQIVAAGALRGYRDVRIPTILTFVVYWLICLPVGFFFAFRLDGTDRMPEVVYQLAANIPIPGLGLSAPGVWVGLVLGLGIAAVCLVTRYACISRIKPPV